MTTSLSEKIIDLVEKADDVLSTDEIRGYFEEQHSYSMVRKTLSRLVKDGMIVRLHDGYYVSLGDESKFDRQKALLKLCSHYKLPYRRVRNLIGDLVKVA